MNDTTEPTVFAVSTGTLVRVQMWTGNFTVSVELSQASAQKLVDRLQDAIATLPREGTPADLGCDSL